jgi:phosphate uptake regulator
MLRELITILRATDPLRAMHDDFTRMTQIAHDMTVAAGEIYFGDNGSLDRTQIYEMDVEVNQLERGVRKQVAGHLSLAGHQVDMPYCLLLMSLVKDVERIGDYAKNLAEVGDFCPLPLPEDNIKSELVEIRQGVEDISKSITEVLDISDTDHALELINKGRETSRRCKQLVQEIAKGSCEACVTTAQILGCRYYKRIGGHALNVLTSVVMPLHKVDYFDEEEIARLQGTFA